MNLDQAMEIVGSVNKLRGMYDQMKIERDQAITLLATERDAFGKKETELLVERNRLKDELSKLSCPHCGADVDGRNWKAAAEERNRLRDRCIELLSERARLNDEIENIIRAAGCYREGAEKGLEACRAAFRDNARLRERVRKLRKALTAIDSPMATAGCGCYQIAELALQSDEREGGV